MHHGGQNLIRRRPGVAAGSSPLHGAEYAIQCDVDGAQLGHGGLGGLLLNPAKQALHTRHHVFDCPLHREGHGQRV